MKRWSLIIFLIIVLLVGCSNVKTQKLAEFIEQADIAHVEKVILTDGTTGEIKEITDAQQIDELLALIGDIMYTPQENQQERVGWLYWIKLLDGEGEFGFTLHEIDGTYYDTEPDIYQIVDRFYKAL